MSHKKRNWEIQIIAENTTITRRLAVLIDADNVPAKHIAGIFEEIARLGEAGLRRVYGDFSTRPTYTAPQGWTAAIMAEHAIIPHQQFAYTTGKNSSDIAMVIDAMDILHSGRFDGFVLVSSDSDFTRLASRIREQGIEVFGIGEHKTPRAFVAACNRFIHVENISAENKSRARKPDSLRKQDQNHVFQLINNVMKSSNDADGWTNPAFIGHQLRKMYPDFDPRTYGEDKLGILMRSIERLEENPETGYFRVKCGEA